MEENELDVFHFKYLCQVSRKYSIITSIQMKISNEIQYILILFAKKWMNYYYLQNFKINLEQVRIFFSFMLNNKAQTAMLSKGKNLFKPCKY